MTVRSISFSALAASCLLTLGCTTTPDIDIIVHEAPKGAVYLERNPDRSFHASHPARIDQALIARALQGVIARDESTAVQSVLSKAPAALRAFTDEDVRFIVPHITGALAQAAPDQRVGFRVRNYPATLSYATRGGAGVGSSEPPLAASSLLETTSGHLLLSKGGTLYLTVSQYRKRAERADTINMANRRLPDASGQGDKVLAFVPEAALKTDHGKKRGLFGATTDTTFVIDYERLAALPLGDASPSTGTVTAGQPQTPVTGGTKSQGQPTETSDRDLQQIRTDLNKKNEEIDALKKEMESIRREMKQPAMKPHE